MFRQGLEKISAIETYGTAPITREQRKAGFTDSFLIMVNYLINPGTILTSAIAVSQGLSVLEVLLVQSSAVMVGIALLLFMARIGVDYGITGQMACRVSLGYRGGKYVTSPLRVICSIYWFAFQTVAGGMAIQAILQWLAIDVGLIPVSLTFALLQVVVAVAGYDWLRHLFSWAFPIKLFCIVYLLLALADVTHWQAPPLQLQLSTHWLLVIGWFNGILCSMLTLITDAADFTRYQYSLRKLWWGAITGSFIGVGLGAFIGAYACWLTGGSSEQLFQNMMHMLNNPLAALVLLLLIVFDNWTINIINLYSGGLSLNHVVEHWPRWWTTALVSIVAIVLSSFPAVVSDYLSIITVLGWLFPAITGVLLVDLFTLNWAIDVPELYQPTGKYCYQKGFHLISIIIVLFAASVGLLIPETWPVPLVVMSLSIVFKLLYNHEWGSVTP